MPPARDLVAAARQDAGTWWRWTTLNVVAASTAVPRPVRAVLYRAAGHDIRTMNILDHCVLAGRATLTIGEDTFVNRMCFFDLLAPVTIGRECQIAQEVMFCTATHALRDGGFARRPHGSAVRVGDGCWIGARATLLPGITVGDGCVVGAGSVVTSSCDAGGVYAGVPARRIRDVDGLAAP